MSRYYRCLILTTVAMAACDDLVAPNLPPEATGTFPAHVLEIGDSATFDVAGYFSDPDGDMLAYTAESTDPRLATATMAGSTLTIAGIAPGLPSVTVTATDPDGLFAALGTTVRVRLPNRPPEAVGTLPAASVTAAAPLSLDAIWLFTDPDGDSLAYSAMSADESVVAVAVSGSIVMITAVAGGITTVTITATDPEGLSASRDFRVQSGAGPTRFREDFDSLGTDWELEEAHAEVSDGVLLLANTEGGAPGRAALAIPLDLVDWQARFRIARADQAAAVRVVFHTADQVAPIIAAEFGSGFEVEGEDTNFRFWVQGDRGDGPMWLLLASGYSDAIDLDEPTALAVSIQDLVVTFATEDGEAVFSEDLGARGAPPQVGFLRGLELWTVPLDDAAGRTGLVDWIELAGGSTRGTSGLQGKARFSPGGWIERPGRERGAADPDSADQPSQGAGGPSSPGGIEGQ